MSSLNMTFPDTVLAFQILEGAGLNENQRQIALTLANDLTFFTYKTRHHYFTLCNMRFKNALGKRLSA